MAWQSWKQENEVSYVSSHLLKIKLPLGVALYTQSFPAFLQEAVSRTQTHDLMVTRQQLHHCAMAPLLVTPL